MPAKHVTLRLSRDLVEEARGEAETLSRSTSGQIEHWARLGRAVERSPGVSQAAIRAVLRGEAPVEGLPPLERAAVFAGLGRALAEPGADERAFYAEIGRQPGATGRTADGVLVRRTPEGGTEPIPAG